MLVAGVEPDEHRRVLADGLQHRTEPPQGVLAQQAILPEHQLGVLDLGEAGGEVVVPEQGHLLAERVAALEHAVQPPAPELAAVVVATGGDAADIHQGLRDLLGLGPSPEQQVERGARAEALGLVEILATGPEARPAIEVGGPLASPRIFGRGPPGLPGQGGIDRIWGRALRRHAPPLGCRE